MLPVRRRRPRNSFANSCGREGWPSHWRQSSHPFHQGGPRFFAENTHRERRAFGNNKSGRRDMGWGRNRVVCGLLLMSGGAALSAGAAVTQISGAGATFPYPLYAKWAATYAQKTGIQLNYQSIGSGGGIKQISQGTVDFGASDAPLKPEELQQMGLVQFPTVLGGVVPVVNIDGVPSGKLKITGDVLADIYLGKIKKWNDQRLTALNAGTNLPDRPITVVHRADGSGTTWIFTNYLTKVSNEWGSKVGNDKSVSWPTGVGGKGNEGVSSYVSRISGAIGYVEYAYALQNKIPYALLRNKDGQFVAPTSQSFQEAAASADWAAAPGFYVVLTSQAGAKTWPITGA